MLVLLVVRVEKVFVLLMEGVEYALDGETGSLVFGGRWRKC